LKHRHRATANLSNVVPLSPNPEWVKTLPNGKLPDRGDFKRFSDDVKGRVAAWPRAVKESERLRDEFAARVEYRHTAVGLNRSLPAGREDGSRWKLELAFRRTRTGKAMLVMTPRTTTFGLKVWSAARLDQPT